MKKCVVLCGFVWVFVWGLFVLKEASAQRSIDFQQVYERGKVKLRQKFYADAIKDFKLALQTNQGNRHFGVHYYLAKAYFWFPDIPKALRFLRLAKRFARRKRQQQACSLLKKKIGELYGRFKLQLEVDPDEAGRLKLGLRAKSVFSHKHKRRYLKIITRRLRQEGLRLDGNPLYLPRGEYQLRILQPQCLRYALMLGSRQVRELSVGKGVVQWKLNKGRSCSCQGGQKLVKKGEQFACVCPSGTGWNTQNQRCEIGSNPWPWILAGVGIVVAGTLTAVLVLAQPDGTDYRLLKKFGSTNDKNDARLWKDP